VRGPTAQGPDLYARHRGQFTITAVASGNADALDEGERSTFVAMLGLLWGQDGPVAQRLTHRELPWIEARPMGLAAGERGHAVITTRRWPSTTAAFSAHGGIAAARGMHPRVADLPTPRRSPATPALPARGSGGDRPRRPRPARLVGASALRTWTVPWGWHSERELTVVLHDFPCARWKKQRWPTDRSKAIPVEHICPDAQRRLLERRSTRDNLVEFRVSGAGTRMGRPPGSRSSRSSVGPRHEVCPP